MASLRPQCVAGSFRKSWASPMNVIMPLTVTVTRGSRKGAEQPVPGAAGFISCSATDVQ